MSKISKKSVNYRRSAGRRKCRGCSMFLPIQRGCTLVEGIICPDDVCDRWNAR